MIDSYLDGALLQTLRSRAEQELIHDLHELRPEETAGMVLLQSRFRNRSLLK